MNVNLVLIVTEDREASSEVTSCLHANGYEGRHVTGYKQASYDARTFKPVLTILDSQMMYTFPKDETDNFAALISGLKIPILLLGDDGLDNHSLATAIAASAVILKSNLGPSLHAWLADNAHIISDPASPGLVRPPLKPPSKPGQIAPPPRPGTSTTPIAPPPQPGTATAQIAPPPRPGTAAAHIAPPPRPGTAAAHIAPPPRPGTAAAQIAPPPRPGTSTVPIAPPPRPGTSTVPIAPPPRTGVASAPVTLPPLPATSAAKAAPIQPVPAAPEGTDVISDTFSPVRKPVIRNSHRPVTVSQKALESKKKPLPPVIDSGLLAVPEQAKDLPPTIDITPPEERIRRHIPVFAYKHILVVDKDPLIQHRLRGLAYAGVPYEWTSNIADGAILLKNEHPSAVFIQESLDEITGLSACAYIKNIPAYTNLPIFIITSEDSHIAEEMLMAHKADGVIHETFTTEHFLHFLKEHELLHPISEDHQVLSIVTGHSKVENNLARTVAATISSPKKARGRRKPPPDEPPPGPTDIEDDLLDLDLPDEDLALEVMHPQAAPEQIIAPPLADLPELDLPIEDLDDPLDI